MEKAGRLSTAVSYQQRAAESIGGCHLKVLEIVFTAEAVLHSVKCHSVECQRSVALSFNALFTLIGTFHIHFSLLTVLTALFRRC